MHNTTTSRGYAQKFMADVNACMCGPEKFINSAVQPKAIYKLPKSTGDKKTRNDFFLI